MPAKLFDLFRFLIVEPAQNISSLALNMKKFVELGMDSLRVAVTRPLDEKGHHPSRERGKSL